MLRGIIYWSIIKELREKKVIIRIIDYTICDKTAINSWISSVLKDTK